jgi:hypothetical protein
MLFRRRITQRPKGFREHSHLRICDVINQLHVPTLLKMEISDPMSLGGNPVVSLIKLMSWLGIFLEFQDFLEFSSSNPGKTPLKQKYSRPWKGLISDIPGGGINC